MTSSSLKKNILNGIRYWILSFALILITFKSALGQSTDKFDFERIEDNSFLIEEAYNQEPGVIQHISAFQLMKGNVWQYSFTEEWPVPGQRHQLSTTIPLLNNGEIGIGDIALNYRYQAIFKPRFAFSPRFSFLLPTGNFRKGLGAGVPGYQLNLPVSYLISRKIAMHYNAGITFTPDSKNGSDTKSDQTIYNYGFSLIFLLKNNFNFMFEVAGNTTTAKSVNTVRTSTGTLFINPGLRYAFNFKSGLQIVPGAAVPIGIGPSRGNSGVFFYLSFEHPFWKPKS